MCFNPTKRNIMKFHRSRTPKPGHYDLCEVVLEEVEHAKYLGITISNNLELGNHVDIITRKASNTLNFLQRNLKYCPKRAKQTAYFSLVRSVVEYGGAIWDPYLQKDKDKLEKINRRAARFVANDYEFKNTCTQKYIQKHYKTIYHSSEMRRIFGSSRQRTVILQQSTSFFFHRAPKLDCSTAESGYSSLAKTAS